MTGHLWFDYIYIAAAEEAIFRMIPLEIFAPRNPLFAFCLAIFPYALLHFIKFNAVIVMLCVILAAINALIYYNMKRPYGYMVCVVVHYIGGMLVYLLGLIK